LLSTYAGSLARLYDAVSELIFILNEDRQIVFFNSHVPRLLGNRDPEMLYGLRPGEALGCIYFCKGTAGCGTSEFCSQCGAVNAILQSLENKVGLQECRLLRGSESEAVDLLVRTTPLVIEGQKFSIMAVSDISHEKRRRALERIFFHDVMNTALSINILSNLLEGDPNGEDFAQVRNDLITASKRLLEELRSQKELNAAEHNELKADRRPVRVHTFVADVVETVRRRHDCEIVVNAAPAETSINTDPALLGRVVSNMITNAVEASHPGQKVTVSWHTNNSHVDFSVHNECFIPREVQLQLFQRSFSTKGAGRGLGTYSMKLLSERYLGGTISFESSEHAGTTFTAHIPL
jgi:signal transduction histidine kinase